MNLLEAEKTEHRKTVTELELEQSEHRMAIEELEGEQERVQQLEEKFSDTAMSLDSERNAREATERQLERTKSMKSELYATLHRERKDHNEMVQKMEYDHNEKVEKMELDYNEMVHKMGVDYNEMVQKMEHEMGELRKEHTDMAEKMERQVGELRKDLQHARMVIDELEQKVKLLLDTGKLNPLVDEQFSLHLLSARDISCHPPKPCEAIHGFIGSGSCKNSHRKLRVCSIRYEKFK